MVRVKHKACIDWGTLVPGRLNLHNKPITLFTAGAVIGLNIVASIGVILYALAVPVMFIASGQAQGPGGLAIIVMAPLLLYTIAQAAVVIVVGYVLLKGIYRWSSPSIIMSAVLSSFAFITLFAAAASQYGATSSPVGIGLLCFFAMTPLVMGVIAYNDLRYRLPKIKKQLEMAQATVAQAEIAPPQRPQTASVVFTISFVVVTIVAIPVGYTIIRHAGTEKRTVEEQQRPAENTRAQEELRRSELSDAERVKEDCQKNTNPHSFGAQLKAVRSIEGSDELMRLDIVTSHRSGLRSSAIEVCPQATLTQDGQPIAFDDVAPDTIVTIRAIQRGAHTYVVGAEVAD